MFRTVLAVAAITIGMTAVAAQSDPIAARKALMKEVGAQTKTGGGMAKGEVPYDQAKAQGILAVYVDAAGKLPTLFPENSKTGGDTAALPAIWANMADFKGQVREVRRGGQGGAVNREGPRQLQGGVSRTDQELRRLPRDLSGQEELTFSDRPIEGGRPL